MLQSIELNGEPSSLPPNVAPAQAAKLRLHEPVRTFDSDAWRQGAASTLTRRIAEETALAVTYNGGTYAVMMGTPQHLRDFAIGFSLTEGIIQSAADIETLDVVELDEGIELRMWISPEKAARISERRRRIAGPTGCGICGLESIAEAARTVAVVPQGKAVCAEAIMAAMAALSPLQTLNTETRSVHAAAFWTPEHGIVALREDVGRHNALDKLAGCLSREGRSAADGMLLLTSRVSVEMVQKAASIGVPLMVAISTTTALAVRAAASAEITLCGIARADGFEVFSHPQRVRKATVSPDALSRPAA